MTPGPGGRRPAWRRPLPVEPWPGGSDRTPSARDQRSGRWPPCGGPCFQFRRSRHAWAGSPGSGEVARSDWPASVETVERAGGGPALPGLTSGIALPRPRRRIRLLVLDRGILGFGGAAVPRAEAPESGEELIRGDRDRAGALGRAADFPIVRHHGAPARREAREHAVGALPRAREDDADAAAAAGPSAPRTVEHHGECLARLARGPREEPT